jgi:tRNA A37 methylthiotransferase MiaB
MNEHGTSEMIVTGQNLSTWRKTCPNATLSHRLREVMTKLCYLIVLC